MAVSRSLRGSLKTWQAAACRQPRPAPPPCGGVTAALCAACPGERAPLGSDPQRKRPCHSFLNPFDLSCSPTANVSPPATAGIPLPVVKLFTPDASATWLLTELDPADPDLAFGLCDLGLGCPELGYVRLSELESRARTTRTEDRARPPLHCRPPALGLRGGRPGAPPDPGLSPIAGRQLSLAARFPVEGLFRICRFRGESPG